MYLAFSISCTSFAIIIHGSPDAFASKQVTPADIVTGPDFQHSDELNREAGTEFKVYTAASFFTCRANSAPVENLSDIQTSAPCLRIIAFSQLVVISE